MSDPFLGEIRMFAGTFAPRGWALCDGQLMAISQNAALFSLVGTYYGGDGRTKSGSETVTLNTNHLPAHSHSLRYDADRADVTSPVGNSLAASAAGDRQYAGSSSPNPGMHSNSIAPNGGSQAHDNMPPFLCIHFIIALMGVYPSRT